MNYVDYGFAFRAVLFCALAPICAFLSNYVIALLMGLVGFLLHDNKKFVALADKMIGFPTFLLPEKTSDSGKFIAYWAWGIFCSLTICPFIFWLSDLFEQWQ